MFLAHDAISPSGFRAGLLAASGYLRSELGASFVLSALSPFPACTTRGASRRFLFGGRDLVLCFLLSNRNFAFRVERWWTCYVNHQHGDTAGKIAGKISRTIISISAAELGRRRPPGGAVIGDGRFLPNQNTR